MLQNFKRAKINADVKYSYLISVFIPQGRYTAMSDLQEVIGNFMKAE